MRHVLRKESRIEATKLADRLLVVQHGIKALTFSAQNELKRVA
jgi:hypothetical protein